MGFLGRKKIVLEPPIRAMEARADSTVEIARAERDAERQVRRAVRDAESECVAALAETRAFLANEDRWFKP